MSEIFETNPKFECLQAVNLDAFVIQWTSPLKFTEERIPYSIWIL